MTKEPWDWLNNIRQSLFTEFINVKHPQFGAKGDEVTDDTDAIEAALNYANSTNGGNGSVLFFPAGKYYTTRTLTLPDNGFGQSNVRIMGSGIYSSRLLAGTPFTGSSMFVMAGATYMSDLYVDAMNRVGLSCVSYTSNAFPAYFERINFVRGVNGLINAGGFAYHVHHCFFNACTTGLRSTNQGSTSVIANSYFLGGVGIDISDTGNPPTGVRLIGNAIEPTGGHGIYFESGSNHIIANNKITGTSTIGIHLDANVDDVVIEGNVIAGGSGEAIDVPSGASYINIANNRTTLKGIRLVSVSHYRVGGNQMTGSGANLTLTNTSIGIITDNDMAGFWTESGGANIKANNNALGNSAGRTDGVINRSNTYPLDW